MTSESLWNHNRDDVNDDPNENNADNSNIKKIKEEQVNLLNIRQK